MNTFNITNINNSELNLNHNIPQPIIKDLGIVDYTETLTKMQLFTESRTDKTIDEFWLLQHPSVFTLGLAGKREHFLHTSHNIPIIQCDRGGQVTYHGIGQLVVYMLINLNRAKLSVRDLVTRIENGVINYLASININANSDRLAPGIYVKQKKIASLGLKIKKGYTYHGLSFNINMDLTPFSYINVCGYRGLQVTQMCDELPTTAEAEIKRHNESREKNLQPQSNSSVMPITVSKVALHLTPFLVQAIYAKT